MATVDQSALLHRDAILATLDAAITVGLTASRDALLGGVHSAVVAGLPRVGRDAEQTLSDLDHLNAMGELPDGTRPLAIWLQNAAALARPRCEAMVFQTMFHSVVAPPAPLDQAGRGAHGGAPPALELVSVPCRVAMVTLVCVYTGGVVTGAFLEVSLERARPASQWHDEPLIRATPEVERPASDDRPAEVRPAPPPGAPHHEDEKEERRRASRPTEHPVPPTTAPDHEDPTDAPPPYLRQLPEHRADAPLLRVAPVDSPGAGLDKRLAYERVDHAGTQARTCFEQRATFTLTVVFAPSGEVARVDFTEPTHLLAAEQRCVAGVIRTVRAPPFAANEAALSYSFL
jgi:hypothetical protein